MRWSVPVLAFLAASAPAQGVDLAKQYPATLDHEEGAPARDWTCGPGDVWKLRKFTWRLGDQLAVELGPSQVVFGKHGTNVVWAVVLPDKPARLSSELAGDGERVTSLWLRFHPALVSELFPKKTVRGPGDAVQVVHGRRVYHWKINSSWQAGNQPVIPWRRSIVIDAQTVEGPRRFFMADTDAGTVKYEPFFQERALPPSVPIARKDALAAFDATWKAFDRDYAMFSIKDVDWKKARKEHRKAAAKAETSYEAAAAIATLVAELEDLHVWVRVGDEFVPGYSRPRPQNGNLEACKQLLGGLRETKHDMVWGRTDDDIGYVNVYQLGDQKLTEVFDDALEQLADTWALVLDLRFNGGGDELLGRSVAGRFLDEPRVYSYNHYRSGPKHDDLGPRLARECAPRGPWRYESPVIVLLGQRTMSSAESFALMLAECPQVTTMGDRSAGSSGNPRRLELAGEIVVNLPRWLDLRPDGKPLDVHGVEPDVRVEAAREEFSKRSDPVLAAALERLRAMPEGERKAGKR